MFVVVSLFQILMLTTTSTFTLSSSPSLPSSGRAGRQRACQRKKRCHGNRKLRSFRKKCRRREMAEVEIQQLITQRLRAPSTTNPIDRSNEAQQTCKTTTTTKKRKRMATSASSRSISQRLPKRSRQQNPPMTDPQIIEQHDQHRSRYLTKTPRLLFQMLRLHLNHPLKGKQPQQFIYHRLHLYDRQYRLDLHRHLWQSFRELGANHEVWPVSLSVASDFSSSDD